MSLLHIQYAAYVLLGLMVLLAWAWGSLAILFAGPGPAWLRYSLLVLFISAPPLLLYFAKSPWQGLLWLTLVFAALLLWWVMLKPQHDRDWQADVARLPHGEINGDTLVLHNVRNFHYRDKTDFDAQWETRSYDLSGITSLDLFLSYWDSPHIAHTILSWGFANGDHLAVSIEARKDKTQAYSSIKGFFKQFTLVYIAADERDLIRLRTTIRKEEVYLYPLIKVTPDRARALLESYVRHMNELSQAPQFYHALWMNCTSTISLHTRIVVPDIPVYDWRLIANGHIDKLLFEYGAIRNDLPFEEVRKTSRVDLRMQELDDTEFSIRLRNNGL